ncbi:hypothetical protein DMUE_2277 [Dictyocoela muelleri]|nr:hypothetical protein DMUE_2277 [Dictyocoela muelleri]
MITIDFEMSSFTAYKEIFVETKIVGCFFHFTKNIYKKIQAPGITSEYMTNIMFRKCFKMIVGFSTVPISFLKSEIDKLDNFINNNSYLENMKSFWAYFISIYCRDLRNSNHVENVFSVGFWNISERIILKIPKKTNNLEEWHRSLNNIIKIKNPSLFEFSNEIRNHHALTEYKINKIFIEDNEKVYEYDEK